MLRKIVNSQALLLVTSFFAVSNAYANNSTGTILFPLESETKTGNLLLVVSQAADPEGVQRVDMKFANSASNINICNGNCSTSLRRPVVGINPLDFSQQRGALQMELVITDNQGTEQVVDTVNFNWLPPVVSNLSATRQPGSINVTWDNVTGASRYNLYVASEPDITPRNINSKPNAQVFRSLNSTNQQITGLADAQGLFALVTAVDRSGESAFSEELRIPALNNQVPEALDDQFTVSEDANLQGNVLLNDSDPENTALIASLLTTTENGTLSLQDNGSFSYQPNANFNGADGFSYQAIDQANGVAEANVVITVNSVNDTPVAANDQYNLAEDTALTVNVASGVLSNDSDIEDADQLTVTLLSGVSSGSLALNSDGSFSYQPRLNFFGQDSFTYQVIDSSNATDSATVTLTINNINDLPQANDDNYQTLEDTTLVSSSSVLANDTDADITANNSQELSVSLISGVNNGTLSLTADGQFVYQPNNEFSGSDSFTYLVTDSAGATSQANVTIEVTNVNDAPITGTDSYTTSEDQPLQISAAQGVLANDTDPDSSADLTASLSLAPTLGMVSLNSDGSFSYTPNNNAFGQDTFSYNATDEEGLSSQEQVQITITAVNDNPIAINDQATTGLNQAVSINVLENDSDPDNGTLTVSQVSASNGNATTNGTSVTFTPENNFFGVATLAYTISNESNLTASAQVTIDVATGISISADDDTLVVDEDTSTSIDVLANDTGTGVITIESATANAGSVAINPSGTLTYTPTANFNGSDTISYSIRDSINATASAQVSVTINSINDAPVAVNDSASTQIDTNVTINVLANDSDIDGDNITITNASAASGSVAINAQQLVYTPASGFSGQTNVNYTIADSLGDTDSALVTITVSSSDLVANNDTVTTAEDTSININVLANDTGDQGLTISDASVSRGGVNLEEDNTLTYTPELNFSGTTSFTYFITDNTGQGASATVTVNVTAVNDGPTASPDTYVLTSSQNVTIPASAGVLNNDSDIESDSFTATIVTAPSHSSSFTLNADGSFNYQHNGSNNAADSFTYAATDGTAGNTVTVTLNIANVNVPAMLCNIPPLSAMSGEAFSFNLTAKNPDNDNLTYSANNLPSWLTLSSNTLSGTPTDSDIGVTNNIELAVTDGKNTSELSNIQLTVFDDFGTSDVVDVNFGSLSGPSRVRDMAIDRNGNIVAVGSVNESGESIAVARFKPNGILDTSFSGDGIYTLDLSHSFDEQATAVVIDKNNHIIVSAWGSEDAVKLDKDFYLLKLQPDGTPDTSFSGDGRASFDLQADKNDKALDLVLHSDGDITLIGHTESAAGDSDIAAVHINSDGSLDTNFGSSGTLIFNQANDQFAHAATMDNQDNIYIVGKHNNGSDNDVLIQKITASGIDSSFNNGTGAAFSLAGANDQEANDVIFDHRGSLIVVGTDNGDFAAYSFVLDGNQVPTADTSAFTAGMRTVEVGDVDTAYKVIADKQGKFYLVGIRGTSSPKTAVIRLNSDGTLDTSFASNNSGIYIESSANGSSLDRAAATLSASGHLITSGPQNDDTRLRHFLEQVNTEFSCNYTSINSNVVKTTDELITASLAPNSDLFFAGKSTNPKDGQSDFVVFKTSSSGVPDINFGKTGILRHDSGSDNSSLNLTHILADSTSAAYLIGYAEINNLYIAKYTNKGQLDTSFANSGVNNFGSGDVSLVPTQALIDSSNNLFLMGTNISGRATVMKLTASGATDSSFANNGITEYGDSQFTANDMAMLNDGSIYLIGKYTVGSAEAGVIGGVAQSSAASVASAQNAVGEQLAIVKYNSSGVLETNFGIGGLLQFNTSYDSNGLNVATNGNDLYVLTQKGINDAQIRKLNNSGTLVNSFGINGVLDLSGYKTYADAQIQYQSSTSTLALQVHNTASQSVLLNLTASSGSLNPQFINAGVATFTHNVANWDAVKGFIQVGDGNYMLFGSEANDMAISLIESDGRISNDLSEVLVDAGFGYLANSIAIDQRSKVLIAGSSYNNSNNSQDFTYARFNFDGSADTSLAGQSAIQITTDVGNNEESYHDILVSPTSEIQVAGQSYSPSSAQDNNIVGLRTQANSTSTDSNFAGGGFNLDLASVSDDKVNDQLLLSDGSVIMAGSVNGNAVLVKLTSSGTLDTNFDSDGFREMNLGDASALFGLTLDANGKIVAVGEKTSSNNTSAVIMRLDANTGAYDTSFDSDGIAILDESSVDKFRSVAVTPLGNYVAVGVSNNQTLIAQFKPDGTAYTNFNSTGFITNDLGRNDVASAVTIDNYGAILVATQTSESAVILRYNDSGTQLLLTEYYPDGKLTKINDMVLDAFGNAYLTGHMQTNQVWQFFVIKFNLVASPL